MCYNKELLLNSYHSDQSRRPRPHPRVTCARGYTLPSLFPGPRSEQSILHSMKMTDPLDPDESKTDFHEPTTPLEPEDGHFLHRFRALSLGSNNRQCDLLLQSDGHTGLRIVRSTLIHHGDRMYIPPGNLEVHEPKHPGVAMLLQYGMLLPERDGGWNITNYQGDLNVHSRIQVFVLVMCLFWDMFHQLVPIQQQHMLVVKGNEYEVFPLSPDVNYCVA